MEETLSFEDLAEKVEPFNPTYTDEFCEYMEKSIRESKINAAKALISARDIIIILNNKEYGKV